MENIQDIAKNHYKSWVVRLTGARGSGKSLVLAALAVQDMICGRKVWSNMPVVVTEEVVEWGLQRARAESRDFWKQHLVGRKTEPLDWDALYSLSEDLAHGTVCIDEAQYFSDSRSSLSLKNRLLNAIVAQVRKRNLNLYYTVKQGDWVDRRLTYETDLELSCEDIYRNEWSRDHGVTPGDMILTRYYDLSGAATGHPVNPKSKYFRSFRAGIWKHMHAFWGAYDTAAAVDLEEGFTGLQLDLKKRVISNKESAEDLSEKIHSTAKQLVHSGVKEISTSSFVNVLNSGGVDGSMQYLGKFLKPLGIERKQKYGGSYVYDLNNLIE